MDEDIPHLLSIGLLEHVKAAIDTDTNRAFFKAFNAEAGMTRLESGLSVLNIVDGARPFQVPSQVLEDCKLGSDPFNKLPSDGRAYMVDGASNELAKWDFEWLDHHMSVFVGKHLLSSHDTMFSHMQASNKPWSSKGVFGDENHTIGFLQHCNTDQQEGNTGTDAGESVTAEHTSDASRQMRNISSNHRVNKGHQETATCSSLLFFS